MSASIGIDFGSTCLRLATVRDGKPQTLGEPIPLWQAAGLAHDPGPEQVIKQRLYGDQPIALAGRMVPAEELAFILLGYCRRAASTALNDSVDACVITVDSQTGSLTRNRLREAAKTAGFSAARLVNETAAVALSQRSAAQSRRGPGLVRSAERNCGRANPHRRPPARSRIGARNRALGRITFHLGRSRSAG